MVAWDRGSTLADRFRAHAGDSTNLYGVAMRAMADDWEAGGPVRAVCAGYEDAPVGSALQLRLLAGVFRLVLGGQAPELVPHYACLGGGAPPDGVWAVMRPVVARHVPELRAALEVAPQTNEVGRSAALLAGLFDILPAAGVSRVRLLELGARAGLNLLVDRFRITGDGWAVGPTTSPVVLDDAVQGAVHPVPFTVVARAGCDLAPVDAGTDAGQVLLTSFVWPFDLHRHARLAAALEIHRRHPVSVDRAGAGDWLAARLAEDADDPAVLTVVWHSITRLYWPPAEVAGVDALLAQHGTGRRVARVAMEFDLDPALDPTVSAARPPSLHTSLWDPSQGRGPRHRRLGSAHDHGLPVRLDPPLA